MSKELKYEAAFAELQSGDEIETRLEKGTIKSIIK